MIKAASVGACLIVLTAALVYSNSLSGPLLFDDESAITLNRQIRHVWPIVDALAPPRDSVLASRPIVNLSFAINYAIGGLSVRGYHIGNIALHILSALLLFGIVRRTLASDRLRDRFGDMSDGVALACALIWVVHPLQTESVNYVAQRTELMMGLFLLLTLYCAIRAVDSATDKWHLAAIVSCLVGVGCKESMVTAPVLVALYDRIFVFGSLREALRRRAVLYAGLALSWVELVAIMSSRANTVGFNAGTSPWTYLLNQALMVTQYLKLAIWPQALVLDYGVPRSLVLTDVLPQAVLVITLVLLTAIALVRKPMLGFLGAWVFVTLAPTSSFVPIVTEVGAERRMYLPLAGLVVLAVIAAYRIVENLAPRKLRSITAAALFICLVWLAAGTVLRNRDYASGVRLLQTSVDRWPNGRARYNLAVVLKAEGRRDEGIAQLRAAVVDNPQAQYVLGSELYDRGMFADAARELRAFVGRTPVSVPDVAKGRNLLALSFAQQGQIAQAIDELQAAVALTPDNPDLHGNLAFLSLQARQFDSARKHYEEYLPRKPGNAFVLTSLGTALMELGRTEEAIERFREALAVDPNHAEARTRLAHLHRTKP